MTAYLLLVLMKPTTSVQRKYGKNYGPKIGWQVPAPWQSGLGQSSTVGTIIGAFINGWAISKYGYKKTVIVALGFMTAFIFIVSKVMAKKGLEHM